MEVQVSDEREHNLVRRFSPLGWRLKAVLPVVGVLLAGLLVFLWVTL